MKITREDKLENCFDGDFVIQYTFDSQWTNEAIQALKVLGQLKYYKSFPKPMFQLTCPDGIFVKGVQGLSECRVIYNRGGSDEARKRFERSFEDSINPF